MKAVERLHSKILSSFDHRVLNSSTIQSYYHQEEAAPQVGQALLHLALSGEALPVSLLHQVVRRIRMERDVTPAQASLIKMVLLSQRDGAAQDLVTVQ